MQATLRAAPAWTKQPVVMTGNVPFYYEIAQYLKRNGSNFLSALPTDRLPVQPQLIVTTHSELEVVRDQIYSHVDLGSRPHIISFDPPYSQNQLENELTRHLLHTKIGRWRRLTIGVDPGRTFGIVALIDGFIAKQHHAYTPRRAAEIVCKLLFQLGADEDVLRIGSGATRLKNQFLTNFAEMNQRKIRIEEVDEHGTNRTKPDQAASIRRVDLAAAAKIARTPGRPPLSSSFPSEPTDGEIRWMQQRSRIETRGLLTISKIAALKILKGELVMEKAIASYRKAH